MISREIKNIQKYQHLLIGLERHEFVINDEKQTRVFSANKSRQLGEQEGAIRYHEIAAPFQSKFSHNSLTHNRSIWLIQFNLVWFSAGAEEMKKQKKRAE